RTSRPASIAPETWPSTSTRASLTRWITRRTLPGQSAGARSFVGAGEIECVAVLAAVDLGVLAEFLFHFVAEEVPALEVAGAELTFFVLLIASAHAGKAALDFGSIAESVDQLGDGDGAVADCVFGIRHTELP